jgi:hypothetical protein
MLNRPSQANYRRWDSHEGIDCRRRSSLAPPSGSDDHKFGYEVVLATDGGEVWAALRRNLITL